MRPRRLAILLLLLIPAATLGAPGDAVIETEWRVGTDGALLVWPHPDNDRAEHALRSARPMFSDLARDIPDTGLLGFILLGLPGPAALSSQCDAVHHFEKLGLGLADGDLVRRIATPPARLAQTEPLRRRARLDRILAVRLAADRKLRAVIPALTALAADPDADRFVRDAARDALTELVDTTRAAPGPELPPLEGVLREIPGSADVVLVADQARVPRWRGIAALGRTYGQRVAGEALAKLGDAATWRNRAVGQVASEKVSELAYELARKYGNARVHRLVAAARFDDGPRLWMHMDGRFEIARLREQLARDRVAFLDQEDAVEIRLPGGPIAVRATATELRVVVGSWKAAAGGKELADELIGAGAPGDRAVWCHFRRPPAPGLPPPLGGIVRATLALGLDRGIHLSVDARYPDEATARAAADAVRRLREEVPPSFAKVRWALEAKGETLTGTIDLDGPTASEALISLLPR